MRDRDGDLLSVAATSPRVLSGSWLPGGEFSSGGIRSPRSLGFADLSRIDRTSAALRGQPDQRVLPLDGPPWPFFLRRFPPEIFSFLRLFLFVVPRLAGLKA